MSETPDTRHDATCRAGQGPCYVRETPDTPSTEALTLLHHVRVVVALYYDDMEALPGGDTDPVPSWDDVMRELRKAIADADGGTQEEQEAAHTSGLTDRAVALIVGSTQDERGQPPIEEAADTSGLREALAHIRDICKPMDFDMSGKPRWFDGGTPAGGGSRERIWRICDAALRGATERPLDVDANLDARVQDIIAALDQDGPA
jgi:hypothetical protein